MLLYSETVAKEITEVSSHCREWKNMDEQSIQDKIITTFTNSVSESSKFTDNEIEDIVTIISSSIKSDKMAESILKIIGGVVDEDT